MISEGSTMYQYGYRLNGTMWIGLLSVLWVTTQTSHAREPHADTDGDARAKGISVLHVTFPSTGEVWRVRLRTSLDGEEFHDAGLGLLGVRDLFRSVAYDDGITTVLVPGIGWFGSDISFFGEPGTYWVRWAISFRDQDRPRTVPAQLDNDIEAVKLEQILQVKPATRHDLDFIAGLGEPDLARYMFGEDFFERQTGNAIEHFADPEVRAVAVIGRLLYATRGRSPDTALALAGPKGDVDKAADTLLGLAKEIPESSYAPYAAYYAGCCYLTALGEALEDMMKKRGIKDHSMGERDLQAISTFLKKNTYSRKAEEALGLAVGDGGPYLKPRAIYMKAALPAMMGAWDEAEQLFEQALAVGGEHGTIRKMVDKVRANRERMKKRESRRRREQAP